MIEYTDCPKCNRRITSHTQWFHAESGLILCQSCKIESVKFIQRLGKDKAMAMSENELMELFLRRDK